MDFTRTSGNTPTFDSEGGARDRPLSDFYDDLMTNPQYAARTAKFRAVVTAYAAGMAVADICDTIGVTRTEVAFSVRMAGIKRGMDTKSMSPNDVADLYSLLFAAQLEIESLRRQLAERQ